MRSLIRKVTPLNIYHIPGTMCCLEMYNNYLKNDRAHQPFCYDAKSIFEANVLFIWGGISPKLREQIATFLSILPQKHALLHLSGCAKGHELRLPKALVIPQCGLNRDERLRAFVEVRQCLVA